MLYNLAALYCCLDGLCRLTSAVVWMSPQPWQQVWVRCTARCMEVQVRQWWPCCRPSAVLTTCQSSYSRCGLQQTYRRHVCVCNTRIQLHGHASGNRQPRQRAKVPAARLHCTDANRWYTHITAQQHSAHAQHGMHACMHACTKIKAHSCMVCMLQARGCLNSLEPPPVAFDLQVIAMHA
jgi:hypothetical protein